MRKDIVFVDDAHRINIGKLNEIVEIEEYKTHLGSGCIKIKVSEK